MNSQSGGTPDIPIRCYTERSIAYESPDHLVAWGTRVNNYSNARFIEKMIRLYPPEHVPHVLDLGCAGGAFVQDCVDAGCFAIGIEGSDYSKRHRRGAWRAIPEWLFTGDITGIIRLERVEGAPLRFDIITSWEVLEHIAEQDLCKVVNNVVEHMAEGALWIVSISTVPDIIGGINLHQTTKPKEWWIEEMSTLGLEHRPAYVRYFNTQFVRGPKFGGEGSVHLVLARKNSKTPTIPKEHPLVRIYDRWLGTLPQRFIAGTFVRR